MYVFNYFHLRKYIIQHTYVPQCAAKDTRDMKRQELKLNHPVTVERPFLASVRPSPLSHPHNNNTNLLQKKGSRGAEY